jgi:hypothetical protein
LPGQVTQEEIMNRTLSLLALTTLAACGGGSGDAAKTDSTPRDIAMPVAESTAAMNDRAANSSTSGAARPTTHTNKPATPPAPVPSVLAEGTLFAGASVDSVTSRRNKAGDNFRVRLADAVLDPQGRTVIPAGAIVIVHIDQIAPAENDRDLTGKLHLTPTAVEFDGASHAITAVVDSVKYSIHGRGVTAGDAAKVGAGAAVGAGAGALIGGNTKSAVIGGVVGGAAGAAVASKTNDRDVIIRPGYYVRVRLTGSFAK